MTKYTLTIIHGSKEHYGRYKDFTNNLKENGIDYVTGDLAAHGALLKDGAHDFSFDEMLESALALVDEAREKYPDHKHLIMGHSMGSFITKYIVYKNLRHFDGVILSGTNDINEAVVNTGLLTTGMGRKHKVSKINEFNSYGGLSMNSKLHGFGKEWLSSDEQNIINFNNDPLCGNDFTNQSLHAMYSFIKGNGSKKTLKAFEDKDVPQLLIYGEQDPVTNFGAEIKSMIKKHNKQGISNHKVITYPGCKHEILFDVLKEQVTADIIEFIKSV